MNKIEITEKVSQMSGVDPLSCEKVLVAFEKVLSDQLKATKGARNVFDRLYQIMTILRNKGEVKN